MALASARPAAAQTQVDLRTQSKSVDFSSAVETKPVKLTATLPAACAVGDFVFVTTAPIGSNLYGCVAANTWALQGGASSLTVKVNDNAVGTRSALNILPGQGIVAVLSDTGSEINAFYAADTSVLQTKSAAQSGSATLCAPASGSASVYTCSLSPTLTSSSLARGAIFSWIPDVACASGGITLNIDGLSPKNIKKADGSTDPAPSDCPSGVLKLIWFDGNLFRIIV